MKTRLRAVIAAVLLITPLAHPQNTTPQDKDKAAAAQKKAADNPIQKKSKITKDKKETATTTTTTTTRTSSSIVVHTSQVTPITPLMSGPLGFDFVLGDWEATTNGNHWQMHVAWNAASNKFEGHLTKQGDASAAVGFQMGELVWTAEPTGDNTLVEHQAYRSALGAYYWGNGNVDLKRSSADSLISEIQFRRVIPVSNGAPPSSAAVTGPPDSGCGLGVKWAESEAGFDGEWRRREASNVFDAHWTKGSEVVVAVLHISIKGDHVVVDRDQGNGGWCRYDGDLQGDGIVTGTYHCSWGGPLPWRAVIRCR